MIPSPDRLWKLVLWLFGVEVKNSDDYLGLSRRKNSDDYLGLSRSRRHLMHFRAAAHTWLHLPHLVKRFKLEKIWKKDFDWSNSRMKGQRKLLKIHKYHWWCLGNRCYMFCRLVIIIYPPDPIIFFPGGGGRFPRGRHVGWTQVFTLSRSVNGD